MSSYIISCSTVDHDFQIKRVYSKNNRFLYISIVMMRIKILGSFHVKSHTQKIIIFRLFS
jgi:hypothetical protein